MKTALRESAEKLIDEGTMHGYLAYDGDVSVGWCNAGDRRSYIRAGDFIPWEKREEDYYIDEKERGRTKSLVCFETAPEYRGQGIAKMLLARVVDDAEKEGYEAVEAYPQVKDGFSALDFTGSVRMYQNAGFEETNRHGKTAVMRKQLKLSKGE